MAELPRNMAARFQADYGLSEYDATQLTQSLAIASYFEDCGQSQAVRPKLASATGSWAKLSAQQQRKGYPSNDPVGPQCRGQSAKSLKRIASGEINGARCKAPRSKRFALNAMNDMQGDRQHMLNASSLTKDLEPDERHRRAGSDRR